MKSERQAAAPLCMAHKPLGNTPGKITSTQPNSGILPVRRATPTAARTTPAIRQSNPGRRPSQPPLRLRPGIDQHLGRRQPLEQPTQAMITASSSTPTSGTTSTTKSSGLMAYPWQRAQRDALARGTTIAHDKKGTQGVLPQGGQPTPQTTRASNRKTFRTQRKTSFRTSATTAVRSGSTPDPFQRLANHSPHGEAIERADCSEQPVWQSLEAKACRAQGFFKIPSKGL